MARAAWEKEGNDQAVSHVSSDTKVLDNALGYKVKIPLVLDQV
jgi:hypothetical protein